MRFGPREIIMLAVALAVPVLSWFFIFSPQQARMGELRDQIEHRRAMLESLRAETSRNDDLERANAEIARRISDLESRLPSNKEVDRIVRQVSMLAVQAGLESPALKSQRPLAAADYREQPLELSTTGNFEGFYAFLVELERLPRITRIPDLELKQVDGETGKMSAKFTLSIYFSDKPEGA